MAILSTQVPRCRWITDGLLGGGVLVKYIDRINLSVAALPLRADFHVTDTDIGLRFSAFFWSYAPLTIPAGMILDRLGVTSVGRWGFGITAALDNFLDLHHPVRSYGIGSHRLAHSLSHRAAGRNRHNWRNHDSSR